MPNFRPWFEDKLGVDLDHRTPSQPAMSDDCIPVSTLQMDFVAWARDRNVCFSNRKQLRLARAHGTVARAVTLTIRAHGARHDAPARGQV